MRRSVHTAVLTSFALFAITLAGCGPLTMPMSVPLSDDDQHCIDAAWNNMLTPVNRVDHQTLLDTLVMYWMYQMGVDRLHLVSEKYLKHAKAVMEIDCDRANPLADQFTVTVLDDHGRTLRRERYSRMEVEQSVEILSNTPQVIMVPASGPVKEAATRPITRPSTAVATTEEAESPEQMHLRLERERRIKAVEASTQPARVGKGPQ